MKRILSSLSIIFAAPALGANWTLIHSEQFEAKIAADAITCTYVPSGPFATESLILALDARRLDLAGRDLNAASGIFAIEDQIDLLPLNLTCNELERLRATADAEGQIHLPASRRVFEGVEETYRGSFYCEYGFKDEINFQVGSLFVGRIVRRMQVQGAPYDGACTNVPVLVESAPVHFHPQGSGTGFKCFETNSGRFGIALTPRSPTLSGPRQIYAPEAYANLSDCEAVRDQRIAQSYVDDPRNDGQSFIGTRNTTRVLDATGDLLRFEQTLIVPIYGVSYTGPEIFRVK